MKRLYIFAGCADTRAMLVDGNHVVGLYFAPSVDDDAQPQLNAGMVVVGRVSAVKPSLNSAFIDLGKTQKPGFLSLKKNEKPPHEGAVCAFEVKRAAMKGKGAVLARTEQWSADALKMVPGSIIAGSDPIEIISHSLAVRPDEVHCTHLDQNKKLRTEMDVDVTNDIDGTIYRLFQETIDRSLSHKISLENGGYAIFDECEGATIIDIDSGDVDGATRRVSRKINDSAMREIFGELQRRSIAGRVVIDFLSPRSREDRDRMLDGIRKEKHLLPDAQFGTLRQDGLFDLTIPKHRQSLLELATKKTSEHGLPPGRSYNTEWIARELIFEIERRIAHAGSALKFDVVVGNVLRDCLKNTTRDLEKKIVARSCERVIFSTDENLEATSYAIYER